MKTMKNMPMRLVSTLALVLMVAFNSCKEDEGVITPQFPELKEAFCEVDDELDITFNANLDWSIQSSAAWCKFVNGEFTETTASGKAGEQTLKIRVSDESWNYQTEDVAELTLKMMDATQVIYKITRGKKEYQDLLVVDSEGNNVGESFAIKGNTGSVTYTSLKATAERGVKVGVKYPKWLIMTYNSASGYYDFTFNTDMETNGGLDFRNPYEGGGEQDFITFVTEDAETAETDKIRKVVLPVSYEGFDKKTVLIAPDYKNITVSYDGKVNVGGQLLSELTSEITAYNSEFNVVVGEQKKTIISESEFIYEYDFESGVEWVKCTNENSTVKITFDQNIPDNEESSEGEASTYSSIAKATTGEQRSAIVLVLPKVIYDEISSDLNGHLLDENKDLKSEFNTFQLLSCVQEEYVEVKEYKFRNRGVYDYNSSDFYTYMMMGGSFSDLYSVKITGTDASAIRTKYQIDESNENIYKLVVPYEYSSTLLSDEFDQNQSIVFDVENMDISAHSFYALTANDDVKLETKDITFEDYSSWPPKSETFKALLFKADINKLPNTYDIAVKDAEGNIVSFCRLEFLKQSGGTSNN